MEKIIAGGGSRHRFTRLQSLFEGILHLLSTMPTPSSSPRSIRPAKRPLRVSTATISCSACARHGHREVIPLQNSAELAKVIHGHRRPRLTSSSVLGAGNITQWAYALPGELKALG